jgi:hypothetical protein
VNRDIIQWDYHAIVNYNDDKHTNPPAYPPTHLLANAFIDPLPTASRGT